MISTPTCQAAAAAAAADLAAVALLLLLHLRAGAGVLLGGLSYPESMTDVMSHVCVVIALGVGAPCLVLLQGS
jgi:hypothetical protein